MSTHHRITTDILREAADWFIRVRSAEPDSEEYIAWLKWLESDPAHREAFDQIQETWDVSGALDAAPWPTTEELALNDERLDIRMNREDKTLGAPGSYHLTKAYSRFAWGALAVSLVLAVAITLIVRLIGIMNPEGGEANTVERFKTNRGESQSAVLGDGSRIELGGLTSVTVKYTQKNRVVIADEGEAFYKVQRDRTRPFVVRSGPVQVTAVGTAFSVRREGEWVTVTVSEGMIEVTADAAWQRNLGDWLDVANTHDRQARIVRAEAGERVRYANGKLSVIAESVQTEVATAWRRGRLTFNDEPLRVVVANLNRYSSREIVLGDPALNELRFTGTVFDDGVDDWLDGITFVFPVRLKEISDHRIMIEPVR